jgi:hypothetical protein
VGWTAARDELSLDLFEGSVEVSGCSLGAPQRLVAGQKLTAGCQSGRVLIGPLQSDAETPPGPAAAVTETRAPDRVDPPQQGEPKGNAPEPRPLVAKVPSTGRAGPDWLDLARKGEFAGAFDAAKGAGVESRLGIIDVASVDLFAEAARLSGHPDAARIAYETLRRRAAGTPRAASAAFALARLDLDRGASSSGAVWLRTYLAEAPSGDLAGAALGRLMEVEARSPDPSHARALAARYLERFPGGPHAAAARRVLGDDPHHGP